MSLCIHDMIVQRIALGFPIRVSPVSSGSYHLTGAYRRLARPSSPLTARASTVYAYSLNLTTHRRFVTAAHHVSFVVQCSQCSWTISPLRLLRAVRLAVVSLARPVVLMRDVSIERIVNNNHVVPFSIFSLFPDC